MHTIRKIFPPYFSLLSQAQQLLYDVRDFMRASAGMTTAPNLQANFNWSHTSMSRFATYSSAQGQEIEFRNVIGSQDLLEKATAA